MRFTDAILRFYNAYRERDLSVLKNLTHNAVVGIVDGLVPISPSLPSHHTDPKAFFAGVLGLWSDVEIDHHSILEHGNTVFVRCHRGRMAASRHHSSHLWHFSKGKIDSFYAFDEHAMAHGIVGTPCSYFCPSGGSHRGLLPLRRTT